MRPHSTGIAPIAVAALLVLSLLAVSACGQGGASTSSSVGATTTQAGGSTTDTSGIGTSSSDTSTSGPGAKTFTLDELAGFDGQNGNPAYIAVDGVVYDVSGSGFWQGGEHNTCNLGAAAGKDLSEVIKQAPPRMRALLNRMPVVGGLAR